MSKDLEALEQQWLAYEVNKAALGNIADPQVGALQPLTITALANADTFCWHPEPIAAVTEASRTLPDDVMMTDGLFPEAPVMTVPKIVADLVCNELRDRAACGWWWFTDPLPIQTCSGPEPVHALLWSHVAGLGTWFSAFVRDSRQGWGAGDRFYTLPTVSFRWDADLKLTGLPHVMREGYRRANPNGDGGLQRLGIEATVEASMRLGQFFIAGLVWLNQRVLSTAPAEGTRQVSRQIQRKYYLKRRPGVTVVHLRRREGTSSQGDGQSGRTYTCRWVVTGHWRNQPYGPAGKKWHRPIWIDGYVKGPADQPLRETQKIFSVKH